MFDIINRAIVEVQTRTAARQEGQAMVEYGLLAGLVSVVAIVALVAIGGEVNDIFDTIRDALTAVPATAD